MKHDSNHYYIMFFIMIVSGLLSTMNVWADSINDIYFSFNDLYMILLMTGWMFLFMGLYYKETSVFIFGLVLVIINFTAIRYQFLINEKQFIRGMIPHHSMGIHMSRQMLNKDNNISKLLNDILVVQKDEIQYMKKLI